MHWEGLPTTTGPRDAREEEAMLTGLLAIGLTAFGINAPDTMATNFVAALSANPSAPSAVADAEGTVDLTVSGDAIQYRIEIRNLKHVTDVALVDAGRAIELLSPADTKGNSLDVNGTVPVTAPDGISKEELLGDIRSGRVHVVVFTTSEPGGVVGGTLLPST
jgi:hypothetical protein